MKKCYLGIKYYEDNRNKDLIEAISTALRKDNIKTVCIARDVEKWGDVKLSSKQLMEISFQAIDGSDIVALEMSEKGVGLGIEAGYATAIKKRLLVLIKEGCELSGTMQGIADAVIKYKNINEIENSSHIDP